MNNFTNSDCDLLKQALMELAKNHYIMPKQPTEYRDYLNYILDTFAKVESIQEQLTQSQ